MNIREDEIDSKNRIFIITDNKYPSFYIKHKVNDSASERGSFLSSFWLFK